ncbi:hypothetical protein NIE88_19015 [Sporolactobacillus shoreicorticis]|uniref:Uncharacterized protein n=1 Tax=Sporolactobacillus shoreicorticis TaxID=1923877 RepID=A0ABW5S928_9BACL|nr:hypothetical protein [Sporolactobacillus shoreicorticis]MCO7127842.1 hypothetical protein [Sporolactobacillus shoreicorticis]
MVKSILDEPLTKEIEATIVKLGKEYERMPSKEELANELGTSFKDAEGYLKKYQKSLTKMR